MFSSLPAAITADTTSSVSNPITIYVCAGDYQLYSNTTVYSAKEDIVVNEPYVIIDGPGWSTPPSPSSEAIDQTTQAIIDGGSGMLVEAPHVAINGLTFDANNFDTTSPNCQSTTCSSSIDVQSFFSGAGDQGEPNVTVDNNLFVGTGGNDWQNGVVHFGLGPDGLASNVNALDSGDAVEHNVFYQGLGSENNAIQMSDTNGAIVDYNTVNYASVDDSEISALWFPGFDQSTLVDHNTLNGGNIDSDLSIGCTATITTGCVNTQDPKSGIKFTDGDLYGTYGIGCTNQTVSNNTISGFVYGISMIYHATPTAPCLTETSGFTVSGNTVSNSRLYGVFIFDQYATAYATPGTISSNTVSNTDTEYFNSTYYDLATTSYATVSYIPGEYDYFDQDTPATANTWTSNAGNGYADPSSIVETSTGPHPPTTTTTTTIAPTTRTVPPTTTRTVPPTTTTTTTIPLKPSVSTSAATLKKLKGAVGVSITVFCIGATCSGTLELTKAIRARVEIGKTKRYRYKTVWVNLGQVRYAVAPGHTNRFTIRLNPRGLKMAKGVKGKRYFCTLAITTSAGTKKERVSFEKP